MLVETLTQVHAIGYEGVSIDRFLRRLQENEIKMIIDVRANPISRKPGFSKTALKARLKQKGIMVKGRVSHWTDKKS